LETLSLPFRASDPEDRVMNDRMAKWIFYAGTIASLALFLALTVDTHRKVQALSHADRLSAQVVAGKRIWHQYNCNDCHTILGFGSYYAPDLTKVYWRRGAERIAAVVARPEGRTTWRKMPHYALTATEMADLVAFLKWTSEIDTHGWPPQDRKYAAGERQALMMEVSPGAALFQTSGCFDCHKLAGTGGDDGPDLTRVGAKMDQAKIEKLLADPTSVNPNADMPAPDITPQVRTQLAGFLAARK
jgi:nitric oxide reductase subunit C